MATNLRIDNAVNGTAQSVKDEVGSASALALSTEKVGIGTTDPQATLHARGLILFDLSNSGGGRLLIGNNPNDNKIFLEGFSSDGTGHASQLLITGRFTEPLPLFSVVANDTQIFGNLGVFGQLGVTGNSMNFDLSPVGGGQLHIRNNPNDNKIFLEGFSSDGNGHASEMLITGRFAESLPLFSVIATTSRFHGDIETSGDIRLTNADCAEDFDICDADQIEPGTVMVLGADGKLQPSQSAYDKRVAGVISGAGDYKPGIVLDKQQSRTGRKPIALLGKVFCKVDAEQGAIDIGDLLTTAPTPGHAMKANDPLKAFGSVIGKALRPWTEGQGLIPILIALQ